MIILVKTTHGDVKKAFIRNTVFHEVDENNKKKAALNSATISSVYWPEKLKIVEIPVKKWLDQAEEANYWNLN